MEVTWKRLRRVASVLGAIVALAIATLKLIVEPVVFGPRVTRQNDQFVGTVSVLTAKDEHDCGGAHIGGGWILTARHCVEPEEQNPGEDPCEDYKSRLRVGYGDYDHDHQRTLVPYDCRYHPKTDLALLRANGIQAWEFPPTPVTLPVGSKPSFVGWGAGWLGGYFFTSNELRQGVGTIVDAQVCESAVGTIDSMQTCIDSLQSASGGDSGGPVVVERRIGAVLSDANHCRTVELNPLRCRGAMTAVRTDLTWQWVKDEMAKSTSPMPQ